MKTVTYDEATHVLVPKQPTPEMLEAARNAPLPAVMLDSIRAKEDLRNKTTYRAMLAAAPSPDSVEVQQGGQPIETAPKDGTEILAWRQDCGWFMAKWTCVHDLRTTSDKDRDELDEESLFSYGWFGGDSEGNFRCDGSEVPTRWQPLPPDNHDEKGGSYAAQGTPRSVDVTTEGRDSVTNAPSAPAVGALMELIGEFGRCVRDDPTKAGSVLHEIHRRLAPAGGSAKSDTQMLGDLLARIHRDGGHYVMEHGFEKAAADAEAKVIAWLARDDAKPVAYHDKDQPNGIAWCPGYPEGLRDITPLYAN